MVNNPNGLASVVAATTPYAQVHGPADEPPRGGFTGEPLRVSYLAAALAGIDLGHYDRRIIAWLAGWDDYTCRLIVSLLVRARQAGYDEATAAAGSGPVLDSESWTCTGCGGQMIGHRTPDDLCTGCLSDRLAGEDR